MEGAKHECAPNFSCPVSVSIDGFSSALGNDCLPGWTQNEENGKNKWVKQYTIIIACAGKNLGTKIEVMATRTIISEWTPICSSFFHIFADTIPIFRVFQRAFQGYQPF